MRLLFAGCFAVWSASFNGAPAQVNCGGPNWHIANGQCTSSDGRWYLGQDNQPHQLTAVSRPVGSATAGPAYDDRLGFVSAFAIREIQPEGNVKTNMRVTVSDAGSGGVRLDGKLEYQMNGDRLIPMTWYEGAEHVYKGRVVARTYVMESDPTNPLVFKVVRGAGYVLQSGKGIITSPDGRRTQVNK